MRQHYAGRLRPKFKARKPFNPDRAAQQLREHAEAIVAGKIANVNDRDRAWAERVIGGAKAA